MMTKIYQQAEPEPAGAQVIERLRSTYVDQFWKSFDLDENSVEAHEIWPK